MSGLANDFYSLEPNGEHFNKLVGPEISSWDLFRAALRKSGWTDLFLAEKQLPTDPHESILFLAGDEQEQLMYLGHYADGYWEHQNEPIGRSIINTPVIAWKSVALPDWRACNEAHLRIVAALWMGSPVSVGVIAATGVAQ